MTWALVVRNGLAHGRIFPLAPSLKKLVLGRGTDADVPLPDRGLSRKHAELEWAGGRWILRDLGSTNGTYLNALPVQEKPIAPRDVVMVGPVELVVVDQEAVATAGEPAGGPGTEALPAGLAQAIQGNSEVIRGMIRSIETLAQLEAAVLIRGETGTGKELTARILHALSRRGRGPFVAVNCGAIPDNLVESELFGHEAGAFTGASARRRGHFEEAAGGTLLLDEVGDLPLQQQAKLLRALEERAVRRVGGSEMIRLDVRVLAATHRDLEQAVRDGKFREDLYHRLKVAELRIPALRERASDIPILARHFLGAIALEMGKPPVTLTDEAAAVLKRYPWPGNVRELKNALERVAILAEGRPLQAQDLSFLVAPPSDGEDRRPLQTLREFEAEHVKRHLQEALRVTGGNKTRAAELLGIGRQTFYWKLKQHGLE